MKLNCSIIRGGTSKGVYILENDLPEDHKLWDSILLKVMGSPDQKQIDGLGGAASVTSKVAIVKKSDRPDADVDYTFAQVSVDKPIVSYKGNCGNISSGVGPFAIEKGLVKASDLGLKGTELPKELDQDPEKLELLEKVRGLAAVKLGLIDDYKKSAWETPGIPKMTFVSEAQDYTAADGSGVKAESIDLCSRMMSMQKTHPSYAMTGAMCTVCAAVIPGSVVNQVVRKDVDTQYIRIGQPAGILPAGVDFTLAEALLLCRHIDI